MSKYIKPVIVLVVGLGLAYWFVSRLNWEVVGEHVKSARIWPLALAAILINLTLVARSLRWRALLSPICPVSLRNLFAATSMGFGSIFVLGRVGEIVRPAVLSLREKISPTVTFATILIERLFDTTMVVMLFAVNLLFIELPGGRQSELAPIRTIGLFLVIGVVFGVILLILLRINAKAIIGLIERISPPLPKKLVQPMVNFMKHLAEGLVVLTNLKLLLTTIFYTALVWGLVSTATWFSFYGFGLKYPFSYVIFVLGFGMVGSVVPTPGGSAGAYHAAASKALEFLGLDPNLAASIAIIHHLIAFGPPFFIALYFLIRDDISLGQLREMLASEEPPPTSEIPTTAGSLGQDKVRSH